MHSHALPRKAGPRLAGIGRRFSRRSQVITAPAGPARQRRPGRWPGPETGLLDPGRAPEESYRDYMFRQSIWP
jgi:hypothetical protein